MDQQNVSDISSEQHADIIDRTQKPSVTNDLVKPEKSENSLPMQSWPLAHAIYIIVANKYHDRNDDMMTTYLKMLQYCEFIRSVIIVRSSNDKTDGPSTSHDESWSYLMNSHKIAVYDYDSNLSSSEDVFGMLSHPQFIAEPQIMRLQLTEQDMQHSLLVLSQQDEIVNPYTIQQLLTARPLFPSQLYVLQMYHYHHNLHWLDNQWHEQSWAFVYQYPLMSSKLQDVVHVPHAGWYLDGFQLTTFDEQDAAQKWETMMHQLKFGSSSWLYQGTCPYAFYESPYWFEPMEESEYHKECDDPDRQIRLSVHAPKNVRLVPLRTRPMARRKSIQVPCTVVLVAVQLNERDDQLEQKGARMTWASRANRIPNVSIIFYHGYPVKDEQNQMYQNLVQDSEKNPILQEPFWMEDDERLFVPVAETWNKNGHQNSQPIHNLFSWKKLQMALQWCLKQFPETQYFLCTNLAHYVTVPVWLQMIQRLPSSSENVVAGQIHQQSWATRTTSDQPTMLSDSLTFSRALAEWLVKQSFTENLFTLLYQIPCSWVHVSSQVVLSNMMNSNLPIKYIYHCTDENESSAHINQANNNLQKNDPRMMKMLLVHEQLKAAGYSR